MSTNDAVSEAERRQLTVLFCDMVESTAIATALEPDDFRKLMLDYQQTATRTIVKHGGVVARYVADGILSYFGFPSAHENDAELAVRCGLELVTAVELLRAPRYPGLNVRVGIATGTVVIGDLIGTEGSSGGGNLPLEKALAAGEAPFKAQRLQAAGNPGTVIVCDTTRRLAGDFYDYEDLGRLHLKGFSAPVAALLARGKPAVESRFWALRGPALLSPLFGRESKLAELARLWTEATSGPNPGRGRTVSLRGEAGLGKSRLTREFVQTLPPDVTVRWLRCEPQSQNTTLYPVIDSLLRQSGILPEDTADTKLKKLETLVPSAVKEAGGLPYIASLLLITPSPAHPAPSGTPAQQKERLFAAFEGYLLALAEARPLLVVVEDLHWIDPTSLSLLERIVAKVRGQDIMLVLPARPEFKPPWPSDSHTSTIDLDRLGADDARGIVAAICGDTKLPKQLLRRILDDSEGVPLFIEELTKTALEAAEALRTAPIHADHQISLPSSLNGALTARLDRLPAAREVAQIGAVIGRGFSFDLLSEIASVPSERLERSLAELTAARLIDTSEESGRTVYNFRHALVREAAYASLIREKRQQLHARTAVVLEASRPETAASQPEILGFHFTEAGDAHAAHAIPYWQKAGRLAASRAAHVEAARFYSAALRLQVTLPPSPAKLPQELELQLQFALSASASSGYGNTDVQKAYGRAHQICALLHNPPELYSVLRGLWAFQIVRDDLKAATDLAGECLAIGRKTGRPEHLIEGHNALGYVLVHAGDLPRGRAELERVVQLYRESHRPGTDYGTEQNPGVAALSLLSHAAWIMGDASQGLKYRDEALGLAEELNHPFTMAFARTYAAMFGNIRRDWEDAAKHGRIAAAISVERDFAVWLATSSMQLALAEGALGKPKEAIATVSYILGMYQAGGAELTVSYYFSGLADMYIADNSPEKALDTIEKGIRHAEAHGEHFYLPVLLLQRGRLVNARAGSWSEDGASAIRSAVRLAQQQGAKVFEMRAKEALAAGTDPALRAAG